MRNIFFISNKTNSKSRFSTLLTVVMGVTTMLLFGCSSDNLNNPLDNDSIPPKPVSNVKWEAISGGAIISYDIPDDPDLLYVLCEYELKPGVVSRQKSSVYNREITLEGFGDTLKHEVKLFAVDRSTNLSKPVAIKIQPLISPVQIAFSTLDYIADFGGITVFLENETRSNLVISTIIQDSLGDWMDYDSYYSALRDIKFSSRGMEPVSTVFGVYIKDRWGNISDTLVKELVPIFEEEISSDTFKELKLPGDANNTRSLTGLWDGITAGEAALSRFFRAADNNGLPARFNIDLGVKVKLSRFRTWGVDGSRIYAASNVKTFELWGSNAPNPDGSFDGWTKIGDYEVVKPSGLPLGELSNEDIATAAEGDEHIVPLSAPEVRYIRVNVLSTFVSPPNSKTGGAWMTELRFWGKVVETF
jgi:hypothetical protein